MLVSFARKLAHFIHYPRWSSRFCNQCLRTGARYRRVATPERFIAISGFQHS
jgi:hypothetical protein